MGFDTCGQSFPKFCRQCFDLHCDLSGPSLECPSQVTLPEVLIQWTRGVSFPVPRNEGVEKGNSGSDEAAKYINIYVKVYHHDWLKN